MAALTFTDENTYARDLTGLYEPWQPTSVPAPRLLALNVELADEIGLDADWLASTEGVAVLAGNAVPAGATPIAQAYSGHQFGNFSPQLGDGRALLLGELVDSSGRRRDVHLKGSGPTPFARRGDGKAAIGPMLREYLFGEAMHALGIPTTRALAVVATGEPVLRAPVQPGAVLTRVASSHLRVGTFQYAAATGDRALLQRLVDYAIRRHYPAAGDAERPALALFDSVVGAQAELVAHWMLVGFIHGVMNTDNTTISGETIDYGPCAFMDAHDPATVFSSIDHGGRYAYGAQPAIMQWNLARMAEALLPLIDDDTDRSVAAATELLDGYPDRFARAWSAGLNRKLALGGPDIDSVLGSEFIDVLRRNRLDHTGTFRSLSDIVRTGTPNADACDDLREWAGRWLPVVLGGTTGAHEVAAGLDRANPIYIPRNHLVEESLDAAVAGDLEPFRSLLAAVSSPFTARAGADRYAEPASERFAATFQTFCGT